MLTFLRIIRWRWVSDNPTKSYENNYVRSGLFLKVIIFYLLLTNTYISAQQASPLQAGHYYPGILNTRDLAYPPSGLFFLWYNFGFSSNIYVDRNGNELKSIPLSDLNPSFPDIEIEPNTSGFGSAPVVAWASPEISFLGNARYITMIAPNYVSADVSVVTERPGIVLDTTYAREVSNRISGFGDMFFTPLGLSWGGKKIDLTTLYTIYAPTGSYKSGAEDNIGLGYWTHQFQGFGYYYPIEDKSTAFMLGMTYEVNSKIKDSEVIPGDRVTLEYGISQFLSSKFEVGIFGGHNWQVSQDSGEDVFWDQSIYDKKSVLFFNASYWPISERFMINLKYGFDYGLRQRFKSNTLVLNLLFVPNLLTSK